MTAHSSTRRRFPRGLLAAFVGCLAAVGACAGGDAGSPTSPGRPAPVPPGIVTVASSGVPAGASADLLITGASAGASFSRNAADGTNWNDVPPGRYTVTVRPIRTPLGTWVGVPPSFEVTVASGLPLQVAAAYRPAPSAMAVTVSGLPANTGAAISVTAPGATPTAVPQSAVLAAAPVSGQPTELERWAFRAGPVTAEGARFAPSRTTLDTAVSFGDTARVAVQYTVATGSLAVAVTGLPAGLAGQVKVLGPGTDSTARPVTATTTLTGLEPGRYRVISSAVGRNGVTFSPATDTLTVEVLASLTASPAPVLYVAQVGRLVLQATGLPDGTSPSLRLVGQGIDRVFTSGGTVDSLPVGPYTVSAATVLVGPDRFAPSPASTAFSLTTGGSVSAAFTYALASGSLTVTLTGLPVGLAGDVRLTGPNGYARTIGATETIRGLDPGRYTLAPRVVRNATEAFGVPGGAGTTTGTTTVDVTAGTTPAAAALLYVAVPTVVDVPVTGLPSGSSAAIQLTDPSGASRSVTGTTRVAPATPGRWRQTASAVNTGSATYAPTPASRDTTVLPGDTLRFGVTYTIATGSLAVTITGLPTGSSGAVTVTGPAGFTRALDATTTLTNLTPGAYTVSAAPVSTESGPYQPLQATQTVTVSASVVAAAAAVTYRLPSGSLAITASGLPGGTTPVFTLSGPGGTRTQTGAGTVTGLAVGSWTVSAASVTAAGITYDPSPTSAIATVVANGTASVSFAFAAPPSGSNYTITNVYLTQAIQQLDNSVALVAGRDALLRVFVTASGANSARPDVRVRVYDGATLLSTSTITAPEPSVRTALAEGTLSSTWNVLVPGANIRTGTRVLVELDPAQAVPDNNRADNVWPANGTPRLVTVNTVPPFTVRFVPVIVGRDTGRVSTANRESFLVTTRRLFPLQSVVSDVRAPFTSSADTLVSEDTNGKWITVLSEINALRTTDGTPATTHYYGVVRVRYTSGIAGYGYVPGRTAVGWDYLPSGDNVAAHEWGHNFSRNHAPCGTSGDANYPYAGGLIGGFGWNPATNTIVSSSAADIMGYCSNTWISDYNWTAVMTHRNSAGATVPAQRTVKGDGLLVWGRVVNGVIQLEPAFRVTAPVTAVPRGATHRVELLDADGATLAALPLEASPVDHAPAGREERQFAVVLPWSTTLEQRLAQIRVRDVRVPTRQAVQQSTSRASGGSRERTPDATLDRSARSVRVRWQNDRYRMAMVRDANTGELMGFVRRSGATVATGGRAVEVVFSDGVRSAVQR